MKEKKIQNEYCEKSTSDRIKRKIGGRKDGRDEVALFEETFFNMHELIAYNAPTCACASS